MNKTNRSEWISISRPYAIAAFEFAREKEEVEHWQEMLELTAFVSCDYRVSNLISGGLPYRVLSKLFMKICNKYIDEYFQNLILIMAEHGRLKFIPTVLEIFKHLRMLYYDLTEEIEVITANKVYPEQLFKIKKIFEEILSRKVKINLKSDKNLLFGMIIRIGDTVIDGSVRGRLDRLADVLQS
ncbi:MAG: ATP synthase F1 subunit delta [Candidatus Dasytiphilus stammeri]